MPIERFIDPVKGTLTGNGSINDPWLRLEQLTPESLSGVDRVIFRSGLFVHQKLNTTNFPSGLELIMDGRVIIRPSRNQLSNIINFNDYALYINSEDLHIQGQLWLEQSSIGLLIGASSIISGVSIRNITSVGIYIVSSNINVQLIKVVSDASSSSNLENVPFESLVSVAANINAYKCSFISKIGSSIRLFGSGNNLSFNLNNSIISSNNVLLTAGDNWSVNFPSIYSANNNLWDNAASIVAQIGDTTLTSLNDFKTFTGQDTLSQSGSPLFTSIKDGLYRVPINSQAHLLRAGARGAALVFRADENWNGINISFRHNIKQQTVDNSFSIDNYNYPSKLFITHSPVLDKKHIGLGSIRLNSVDWAGMEADDRPPGSAALLGGNPEEGTQKVVIKKDSNRGMTLSLPPFLNGTNFRSLEAERGQEIDIPYLIGILIEIPFVTNASIRAIEQNETVTDLDPSIPSLSILELGIADDSPYVSTFKNDLTNAVFQINDPIKFDATIPTDETEDFVLEYFYSLNRGIDLIPIGVTNPGTTVFNWSEGFPFAASLVMWFVRPIVAGKPGVLTATGPSTIVEKGLVPDNTNYLHLNKTDQRNTLTPLTIDDIVYQIQLPNENYPRWIQKVNSILIGGGSSPPELTLERIVINGIPQWNFTGPVPFSGPSIFVPNTIFVSTIGNDDIGARENLARPFATIPAALAASRPGDHIILLSGIHFLTDDLILPNNISIKGISARTSIIRRIAMSDATMITMGEECSLENITCELISDGHYNLVGIYWPGTTSATAKLCTSVITVNNQNAGMGASNVYGCLVESIGMPEREISAISDTIINCFSTGNGRKRALYMTTQPGKFNMKNVNCHARGGEDSGGAEIDVIGGILELDGGSYEGDTFDWSATSGPDSLRVNYSLAVNANSNGKNFITNAGSHFIFFGDSGHMPSNATRYFYMGTRAITATEIQFKIPRNVIIKNMRVMTTTGPGTGKTDIFTVRKNGIDTALSVNLSDNNTFSANSNNAVHFMKNDDLSLQLITSRGTRMRDPQIILEAY